MTEKKNVFVIIGSASKNSANQKLIDNFARLTKDIFNLIIYNDLKILPHFDPELSTNNTPQVIEDFRKAIDEADAILICTPEYVFSIPSGLKNAIEWCVSTTVFSVKPAGLITASAQGLKGHDELKLVMKTLEAKFTEETTLLIQGVKGKIDENGNITNDILLSELNEFIDNFKKCLN